MCCLISAVLRLTCKSVSASSSLFRVLLSEAGFELPRDRHAFRGLSKKTRVSNLSDLPGDLQRRVYFCGAIVFSDEMLQAFRGEESRVRVVLGIAKVPEQSRQQGVTDKVRYVSVSYYSVRDNV
mmetsp:Transcript_6325/g.15680  ORF Transcript_6325/g.15680 Transcript_6325/m.15680 type:complete len:124 (+) Transcript_6325:44-415(+)